MVGKSIHLWGEKMGVRHTDSLYTHGIAFPLHEVDASDDTQALVMICSERIAKDTNDVPTLIRELLETRGLQSKFIKSDNHLFLDSVSPLDKAIAQRFIQQRAGIIALINGKEPGDGTSALDQMTLHEGDTLQLLYRVEVAKTNISHN